MKTEVPSLKSTMQCVTNTNYRIYFTKTMKRINKNEIK